MVGKAMGDTGREGTGFWARWELVQEQHGLGSKESTPIALMVLGQADVSPRAPALRMGTLSFLWLLSDCALHSGGRVD